VDEGKIDACRLKNFLHMAERLASADKTRPR
jgi:hypothetical protein